MPRPAPVYFDYNATTPIDPVVKTSVLAGFDDGWANPSSIHQYGRHARALLDDARERAARVLGCRPSELTFTSGGSEALNAALTGAVLSRRTNCRHIVCSSIEHPAILFTCRHLARIFGFELTEVPVEGTGVVCPDAVRSVLRPDTALVAVMAANNETGRIQPFAEISRLCRSQGILYLCDAVQWFGKEPFASLLDFGADLVPVCAHKFHGPKGVALLYARSPLVLPPFVVGGAQEGDRRAGTENLPAILGFVTALERFLKPPVFPAIPLRSLLSPVHRLLESLPGIQTFSSPSDGLANTLAFAVQGSDSMTLLANLDLEGFCVSSGSACSSGSLEPSHVLRAMGVPPDMASALVRLSLGRESTMAEIERFCSVLPVVLRRSRSC